MAQKYAKALAFSEKKSKSVIKKHLQVKKDSNEAFNMFVLSEIIRRDRWGK